ncbi:SGNH/GDSL hydrolase family protein [Streptomyces sp.]|uniref:SGNH/GDSL hydrolase family protein n=1 Tax=Streptomyces sp. TaxID=1931 RepID=UPI002F3E9519
MGRGWLIRAGLAFGGLVSVLVVLAVTLLPTRGSATEPARARPLIRVLPLGDSITWGQGSPTDSSYRRPLWAMVAGQSRYAVRFVGSQRTGDLPEPANEGHRGYTINRIRAGLDDWMAAARPDVVLLHIGINDLSRRIDPPHAADRLASLVDRIYSDRPGVSIVMMGLIPTTPGLGPLIAAYNERARALESVERRAGRSFRYVAAPALTGAERVDRLHPNDAGYRRIAEAFFPALSGAVAERTAAAASSAAATITAAPIG